MVTLTGEINQRYLRNLEQSLSVLGTRISEDTTLDQSVYSEITPQISVLASTIHWLRWLENEPDYHDNGGIYTTTKVGGNGFPDLEDYTKLLSDQEFAEDHLKSVPELEAIFKPYHAQLFQKTDPKPEEEDRVLQFMNQEYRKRKFYEGVRNAELLGIKSCDQNMSITQTFSEGDKERYRIVFTVLDGVNNIWAVHICDLEEEKVIKKSFFGKKQVIDHIWIDKKGKHISEDLVKLFDSYSSLGAYQLMSFLDIAEVIYPKMVSAFYIGAFYFPELPELSETLQEIFSKHQESFALLARRDYIQSQGQETVAGQIREIYSEDNMQHDEFIVFPTDLKQVEQGLIKMARMKPDVHIYEV